MRNYGYEGIWKNESVGLDEGLAYNYPFSMSHLSFPLDMCDLFGCTGFSIADWICFRCDG